MLKIVSFTSPDNSLDYKFISNYVKINVQSVLARVEGISAANILGEADYSMRLWLDPDRMTSLGLSVADIQAALREQNVQVAAGKIGAPPFDGPLQTEYTLQAKGRLRMSRSSTTSCCARKVTVPLSICATSHGWNWGSRGITFPVKSTVTRLSISQCIQRRMPSAGLRRRDRQGSGGTVPYFPEGLEYVNSYDTTRYVSTAVNQVLRSLFEAVVLVIAITYLFLGNWRATLVPTVAIPVSLVATFSVLQLLGMSINTVTLFGLILAIGIVVDDAILVIENCDRHMREDPAMSSRDAALITMREVGGAIISTTLVLLAVFVPVALLPGITGEMYRQFAVTICVAVVFSSINALTLSPALCGLLLQSGGPGCLVVPEIPRGVQPPDGRL